MSVSELWNILNSYLCTSLLLQSQPLTISVVVKYRNYPLSKNKYVRLTIWIFHTYSPSKWYYLYYCTVCIEEVPIGSFYYDGAEELQYGPEQQCHSSEAVCLNCFKNVLLKRKMKGIFLCVVCTQTSKYIEKPSANGLQSYHCLTIEMTLIKGCSYCPTATISFSSAKTCSRMLNIRTDVSPTAFIWYVHFNIVYSLLLILQALVFLFPFFFFLLELICFLIVLQQWERTTLWHEMVFVFRCVFKPSVIHWLLVLYGLS